MDHNLDFKHFIKYIFSQVDKRGFDSGLLSFCLKLPSINMIETYSLLIEKYNFSIFWEENEDLSLIAFDKCKNLVSDATRRFDLAKKFNSDIFSNLINLDNEYSCSTFPKIFYFFSFNKYVDKKIKNSSVPQLECCLPKLLITKDRDNFWIRMNVNITFKASLLIYLEEIWEIRNIILTQKNNINRYSFNSLLEHDFNKTFNLEYDKLNNNIINGIKLINEEELEKIVLATRLNIKIKEKINIINVIKNLKKNQCNCCTYVWKRSNKDITFGTSPEKLFSFKNRILTLEAIAGTTKSNKNMNSLLKSSKNIREHNFVIDYLIECLELLRFSNYERDKLKVISFGEIAHLCTLVRVNIEKICPFKLLDVLHPSPAVCGTPKEEALKNIDLLEKFDRGNYASPIGWIDSCGHSDFRVAIRGARIINNNIELTAGSGLVKESICEEEIEEIKLKFESLTKQIFV